MAPTVFWPSVLGVCALIAGLWTHRNELYVAALDPGARTRALGPVFIAAALATFSGEHFSDAADLMALVPKWLPLRLGITYFVGVGLLAAALSFVARRAVRLSSALLAVMFALFVALLYLPSVWRHPGVRMAWVFPFREGSYALGAFCLFVYESRATWSRIVARVMTVWTAGVAIYFGSQNLLFPKFSPGVPDQVPTSTWVPAPEILAYVVGAVLIVLGLAALVPKMTVKAIAAIGGFMTVLTIVLFGPDLFISRGAQAQVTAINFFADTLLFAGTMLVIARTITFAEPSTQSSPTSV